MKYLMAMIAVLVMALMLSMSLTVPVAPDTVGGLQQVALYDGPVGIPIEATNLVLDVDRTGLNTDAPAAIPHMTIPTNRDPGQTMFSVLTTDYGSGDDALSGHTRPNLL